MNAALFATIPLLMCMGYFFMGSLPLLVLKHDTPMDSRFIRGFFNTYYVAVVIAATMAAMSYALVGHLEFSAGTIAIACLALCLRKSVLPRMDGLRIRIEIGDSAAITDFRRIHIAGMVINAVQLVGLVWGLFQFAR